MLLKTWIAVKIDSSNNRTYVSAKEFGNSIGLQFFKDEKIRAQVPTNTSCPSGIKEVKFEIVDGTWSKLSDSVLITSFPLNGKNISERLKILKLTENELIVKLDYKKQRQ